MNPREGEELKAIVILLQNLLAIELWHGGLSQGEIAKKLGASKTTVNDFLKGVERRSKVNS